MGAARTDAAARKREKNVARILEKLVDMFGYDRMLVLLLLSWLCLGC